jgi:hypothetical protein
MRKFAVNNSCSEKRSVCGCSWRGRSNEY